MKLEKVKIRHSPLSNRIVIAHFGKDEQYALETRDAMNEFLQAFTSYCFDGKLPAKGEGVELNFGGGDEQFTVVIRRNA